MLDKEITPSFEELIDYCGERGSAWAALDAFLADNYALGRQIRFPYGKKYGWSVKYSQGSRHICDIFAENGAFAVFFKISGKEIEALGGVLSEYTKTVWERSYPCGDGGWLNYRVLEDEHLRDIKKLLAAKVSPKKSQGGLKQ